MSAIRTAAIAVGFLVTMLLPACGQRQAEVGSAPAQPAQVSVQVNNTLAQAVNVFVSVNGTDTFLRQVDANSKVTIPVPGFATGTTATLKAVTFDGGRTYSRANVTLTGTTTFQLP